MARYLILGLVQGLTEFLPVSSSAHLVFARVLLGVDPPGTVLEGALHLATLLAVLVCFRGEIRRLIKGVLRGERESLRYAVFLIVGTIPVAITGLLFRAQVERAFVAVRMAGALLLVTGTLLFAADRALRWRKGRAVSLPAALAVGVAQAAALFPGISRSGATISVGIFLGLDAAEAARFSFLLAVPAIAGAGLYSLVSVPGWATRDEVLGIALGSVVAFVSGFLAIKFLLALLLRGRLLPFGLYCLSAGMAALLLG